MNVDKERKTVMVSQDLERLPKALHKVDPIHQIKSWTTHMEMPKKEEEPNLTSAAVWSPPGEGALVWGDVFNHFLLA